MPSIDHADLVGLMTSAPEIIPLGEASGLRGDLAFNRRSLIMRVSATDPVNGIARIEIPELRRIRELNFTADPILMEQAVWHPEERLQSLIVMAKRITSGRIAISDHAAERKRRDLGREEAERVECYETRLLDPDLQHKARTSLFASLDSPPPGQNVDWNRTLRDMAFCQDILTIRSDRERMFVSDMIARARYMPVTPSPHQAAWLRAVLNRSKAQIRPGSGALRSQLHRVFPVLAMTSADGAASDTGPT